MVLALKEVARATFAIEARTGKRPAILRVGTRAYIDTQRLILDSPPSNMAALADEWSWITGQRWAWPLEPSLLGLELLCDEWLPPDVWRLTDADATLLYDCRMPNHG